MKFAGFQYELQQIKLDLIEESDMQPTDRNRMNRVKRQALIACIEKYGLRDPIDVLSSGSKYEVIEGHGRVQAMRLLNQDLIPARVFQVRGPEEAAALRKAIFEVNNTQLKLSGSEAVEFILRAREHGATSTDFNTLAAASKVMAFMDLNFTEAQIHTLVHQKGVDPGDLAIAKRGVRYINGLGRKDPVVDTDATLVRLFRWVVEHDMTLPLRIWIEEDKGAKRLTTYLDKNAPLK